MKDVQEYQIKDLKRKIFISNLKALIIVFILVAEVGIIGAFMMKSDLFNVNKSSKGDKIAVIRYNKEVTEKYGSDIMDRLDRVKTDPSYKAVLFVMSSPGGSPTASEELSEYLKDFQKDKNITMYIESIAASGGYYIASAVKPLYANKNAIVGSIGVIMPHYNLAGLAKKVGIEEDYIAAGKYKKPISMFKSIDDENRKYMTEHLLKPTYENFLTAVAMNRGLSREQIIPFADGKIYIANDMSIKGILIDKISTLHRVKKMIRRKFKNTKLSFVELKEPKKYPFLPEIKVDLNLKELMNNLSLK